MLELAINDFGFPELQPLDRCLSEDIYRFQLPILKKHSSNEYPKKLLRYNLDNFDNLFKMPQENLIQEQINHEEALIAIPLEEDHENIPIIQEQDLQEVAIPAEFEENNLNAEENKEELIIEEEDNFFAAFDSDLFEEYNPRPAHLKEMPFYELETIDPFSIKCSICFTKKEDYHNLGCKDNFCKSCISLLLENYILSSYVFPDEILCPICSASIPDELVLKLSSENIYNKMLELRENLKVQKLIAANKAMYCPLPNCEGFGYLIPDEKITACNKCKCSICTACKKGVHPGVTCEEAAANSEDSQIEDLLLSQNWKKCPTCGVPVEKIDGCQFVTCRSPLCKGRNSLCYLCGRFLIEAQHYNHYKTKGPFGDTCNTFEGIEEEVDKTQLIAIIDPNAPPLDNYGGEEE